MRLLAYDIETTGLKPEEGADVTVVAFYWGTSLEEHCVINFLTNEVTREEKAEQVARLLDEAEIITAFNGVKFDTPFIYKAFHYDKERVKKWQHKTFDILDQSRNTIGLSFKLSELLAYNNLQAKSGSGLDAIQWAKDPTMWPKLEEYCLDDARLTWEIAVCPNIRIPCYIDKKTTRRLEAIPYNQSTSMCMNTSPDMIYQAIMKPENILLPGNPLVVRVVVTRTYTEWNPATDLGVTSTSFSGNNGASAKRIRFGGVKG